MNLDSPKPKIMGFYQIFGSDGHVYDSLFTAESHYEARTIVETAAFRIRESSGKKSLTGKAQYVLGEADRDAKKWKKVDV